MNPLPQHQQDPAMPRPGTFATLGEALEHPYDESTIKYVQSVADDAWKQAQALAADDRLTPQAKNADIQAITTSAIVEIEQRASGQLEALETTRATLERKARRATVPPADEIAACTYLANALMQRARAGDYADGEVWAMWQQALDIGDKIMLRVMLDIGTSLVRNPRRPDASIPSRFADLITRSEAAIATAEQQKARADLLKLEATRVRLEQTRATARRRLNSPRVEGKTLIARETARQRATL